MTNKQMIQVGLGNDGVKIILFRANVGHETDVVAMLKSHLEKYKNTDNNNIINYKIYKVLGLYDIMLILHVRDFTHDLLKKGSFKHIIQGNELLCFTFSTEHNEQDFFSKISTPAVFITLIKLRLQPLLRFGNVLPYAVAKVMENSGDVSVIGGLGWNELIAIYPHDFSSNKLREIFSNYLGWISALSLIDQDKTLIPLVHKTYSFMGVSYEFMDRLLETFPDFFEKEKGEPCPSLHLSVTADNHNQIYQNITECFRDGEFKYDDPKVMMGVNDISISFTRGPWGGFLDRVIRFRKDNADLILDTRIELSGPRGTGDVSVSRVKKEDNFPYLDLPEAHATAFLKQPDTAHVISTIYCFNHFAQNSLLQDSFLDLYLPGRKLISQLHTRDKYGNLKHNKKMVSQLLSEFQWAMRERAMGAYFFTEGDEHSFSPIKGGLQKILLALESIPFTLVSKMVKNRKVPWQGFISIGLKPELVHFNENIHIPFEYVLSPEKFWWCLIHETGHILTLLLNVLNKEHAIIGEAINRSVNIDNPSKRFFENMADNCFADTFDFIVGFLGNRDLYFKRCWDFLLDNIEGDENPEDFLKRHLVRHFFGWLFEGKFITKRIPRFGLKDVDLRRLEAATFLKSLEAIPGLAKKLAEIGVKREKLSRKISEETAPYLFLLDHFREFLGPAFEMAKELKREYNSQKFVNLINSLENEGKIISHQAITYPHLIPLKLMENWVNTGQTLSFKARIAVILSLYWYSHHNIIPKIFDVYREAQSLQTQSL